MGTEILFYVVGFLWLLLLLRFLRKPIRFIFRLCLNTFFGGVLLLLLNSFGTAAGLHLAVNPATALVTGILGLPGIAAMLFIKLWL